MSTISKSPPESMFELVTDRWTKPFWDAAAEHRLSVPRCEECGTFRMPPSPFCPNCQSQEIEWVTLSGDGELYSYSIVNRAIVPEMEGCVPYVTAVVDLPDAPGARLVTNVVGVDVETLQVGMKLKVYFEDRKDGVSVPRFKVA